MPECYFIGVGSTAPQLLQSVRICVMTEDELDVFPSSVTDVSLQDLGSSQLTVQNEHDMLSTLEQMFSMRLDRLNLGMGFMEADRSDRAYSEKYTRRNEWKIVFACRYRMSQRKVVDLKRNGCKFCRYI